MFSNLHDILNVLTESPSHSYSSTMTCELHFRALNDAAPPPPLQCSQAQQAQQRSGCSEGCNTPEDLEENMYIIILLLFMRT